MGEIWQEDNRNASYKGAKDMPEDKDRYEKLEQLARLSGYKGLNYEIAEIKDGRITKIKNVKIDEVDLTK